MFPMNISPLEISIGFGLDLLEKEKL